MRLNRSILHSAVARRILLLFAVAACMPALLLMVLSYSQVRQVIEDNVRQHLAQTGDAYGRSIYEKLYTADVLLRSLSSHRETPAPHGKGHGESDASRMIAGHGGFHAAHRLDGDEAVAWLAGRGPANLPAPGAAQRAQLLAGKAALLLPASGQGPRVPWLARAWVSGDAARGIVMAQLDDEYFWGDRGDYASPLCVFAADGSVLLCSDAALAGAAMKVLDSGVERGEFTNAECSAVIRTLHLGPQYGAGQWRVVTLQPRSVATDLLLGVMRNFFIVGSLTLLMVALLSVSQIRRTLVPLERLTEATTWYAKQQFDRPVRVDSKDEFGHLALALGGMARQLGRQIGAMRALSDIDREILSTIDVEQIIQRVLAQVAEVLPGSTSALVVPGPTPCDAAVARVRGKAGGLLRRVELGHTGPLQAHCRAKAWVDCWVNLDPNSHVDEQARRELLAALGAEGCWLLPVLSRGRHVGTLVVAPEKPDDIDPEVSRQLHDLGDRVAVALLAREREETLVHRAHHDALTGLPNRALLLDRLAHAVAHARRETNQVALLFVDLDRFKAINDDLGHDAGDQVLTEVAERLRACVRETDTVARLGGDEFVIMLTAVHQLQDVVRVTDEVRATLTEPFMLCDSEYRIGASIGVSMFPSDGDDAAQLLKHADTAMYRAKGEGRGSIVYFEESMNTEQHERAMMERELRLALGRGQLEVHYQPRVDLRSGKVVSAEALVRWEHPVWGSISPVRFIPLAEGMGLIDSIGNWVLQKACDQLAWWQADGLGIERVSVNVSGRQLKSDQLPQVVRRVLSSSGLAHGGLELEVTESVLIDDAEAAIALLHDIRQQGVTIALDDFGTGYSSMSYLRRMPIDVLKIDRSFVMDIGHDESACRIAQAIISMAQALHLAVTAEGVETQVQADLLRGWHCGEAQGYHFARPMTAEAVTALLRAAAGLPDAEAEVATPRNRASNVAA